MSKAPFKREPSEISYELYKELVDELMAPIESSLDCHVRYELYLSKLVYLENLQEQCFRSINSSQSQASQPFAADDLSTIQSAISSTHDFMRETILEALENSFSRLGMQRQSV